jgi:hypothetical protein
MVEIGVGLANAVSVSEAKTPAIANDLFFISRPPWFVDFCLEKIRTCLVAQNALHLPNWHQSRRLGKYRKIKA